MKKMLFNKKRILTALTATAFAFASGSALADNSEKKGFVTDCIESREGYTKLQATPGGASDKFPEWPSHKCSEKTGGVLWWGDPFAGTEPMGDMPIEGDYSHEEAVVKPRIPQLAYYMPCTACHNGKTVPVPTSKRPRQIFMHQDIVPDSLDLKHGKGAMWCLDCHSATNRDKLINHFGDEISFNQPQLLCGKCHGQIYRDWREGIHGKRIGSWEKGGKKRWWVCTECHNPHDVEPPFKSLEPEWAPELPKGLTNRNHELHHGSDDVKDTGHGAAPAGGATGGH
jgi:uncharacterized CHY-type Zn-finger protein